MDLSLITTHAQRLSARLSENLSERSKDLGLDAEYNSANPSSSLQSKLPILSHAQSLLGSAPGLWDRVNEISSPEGDAETKKLLGSKSQSDRVQGLKRVTAMMCRNRPVLPFFPYVTNCLHSPASTSAGAGNQSIESGAFTIRHLVSIYILQHSRLSPDLALLSVNAWQKDLLDPSPVIRSLALRTLAGMGLESVFPLVMATVDRLVNDPNWLVKRTVAESLMLVHSVDPETYREKVIEGPLRRLLKDRSPLVVGSALTAFEVICPQRWDLIHKQFRLYTLMLMDADDTGQHVLMRVLVRYVREHFREPKAADGTSDQDLEKLLASASALFMSRSASVVICATNLYLYLTPKSRWPALVHPLIRLVSENSAQNHQGLLLSVLRHIDHVIKFASGSNLPHLFSDYFSSFTISIVSDSQAVKLAKLRIISSFISARNSNLVRNLSKELRFYARDPDLVVVSEVVRVIGELVSRTSSKDRREGLEVLFDLTSSHKQKIVSEAIGVLRNLLCSDDSTTAALLADLKKIISRLKQLLVNKKFSADSTRSNIYRLVADTNFFSKESDHEFIYFFKYSISNFVFEGLRSKLQILSLVSKSLLVCTLRRQDGRSLSSTLYDQRRIYQLGFEHLMRLARYDSNFAVRDRARFLQGLLMSTSGLLLDDKGSPIIEVAAEEEKAGGVQPLNEEAAFMRGDSVGKNTPGLSGLESGEITKIGPEALKKILFQEPLSLDSNVESQTHSEKRYQASSLFDMVGLDPDQSGLEESGDHFHHSWRNIPAWTSLPLDPSSRDPEDSPMEAQTMNQTQSAQAKIQRSNFTDSSRSFSSASIPNTSADQIKSKEKIVLIPTDVDTVESKPKFGGYRNLDEFLDGSDEDETDNEEDDSTEEESSEEEDDESSSEIEDDGSAGR